jgi:methylene-tetrahydromethanopterin dehydrogenase
MATNQIVLSRGSLRSRSVIEPRVEKPARKARRSAQRKKIVRASDNKPLQPISAAKAETPGSLPILYMLSPQKFMSPFDCNMAADSGYKIVLPYDNVTVSDVTALVQDAIFSRPPSARTGVFIGGKDITLAIEMMAAAQNAMVSPFDISVFADPGGSYTTAAAMVACVEQVLKRQFGRGLKGQRVAVFGATGVVGFVSGIIAAREGAHVRMVAHDTLEPLIQSAATAGEIFDAELHPVEGQSEQAKAKIVRESDVIFSCGPAGVNIISRKLLARAPNLLVAADVNAVPSYGVEGMDLFMNGVPLPGCSTLGVGALAIGDVKYKTQAGLFKRMLETKTPLALDFRDAFVLARDIVGAKPARAKGRSTKSTA